MELFEISLKASYVTVKNRDKTPMIYPGYQLFFSRAAGIFGVGRSREKNLWHGAVLFTVPIDLCAFLSDYIYANEIERLQLWWCGLAREEVSKDPHYP